MKLSLNWLKDYVDPKLSTDELVHRLTMAGLEVEEVHAAGSDTVLDLEITPNRPDCLNTIGLAREIAAICGRNLKLPKVKAFKAVKSAFPVVVDDKNDCPQYSATVVRDVRVSGTAAAMAAHLQSIGIRSISNAVDITNFVLMEMGQPLHVFDLDKISGGKVIVRRAKNGEKIVTLDGIERALDPSILVIADTERPIAIAGIMGGLDTQVTADTKNILLESAQFDMGLVRRGCRKLGLKSDSSYRFERGIDAAGVLAGADRATALLLKHCGGKYAGRGIAGGKYTAKEKTITLTQGQIEGLLGSRIIVGKVAGALKRLGLKVTVTRKTDFKVTVPGFRGDLKEPVDIIEEVARVIGYDNLDVSFPHIQVLNIAPNIRPRAVRNTIAEVLTAQGYFETVTFSLICRNDLERCGLKLEGVGVDNSLSGEHDLMRPSLLPSLLGVAAANINRGQKDLKLFEIGKCYSTREEKWTLGVLCSGRRQHDWRSNSRDSLDLHDLKGALQATLCRLGVQTDFNSADVHGLEGGASIGFNHDIIGGIGRVPRQTLAQWGIKSGDVYFAQIDLKPLMALIPAVKRYEPIPEYPGIVRDISISLKEDVPYAALRGLCRRLGGDVLRNVSLIEEYRGEKVPAGNRGLVVSLLYQSTQRTLREEDVNAVHPSIVDALIRETGAVQR